MSHMTIAPSPTTGMPATLRSILQGTKSKTANCDGSCKVQNRKTRTKKSSTCLVHPSKDYRFWPLLRYIITSAVICHEVGYYCTYIDMLNRWTGKSYCLSQCAMSDRRRTALERTHCYCC